MSTTGEAAKSAAEVEAPRNQRWARLVGNVKRKIEDRKSKNRQEPAADRAARRTANATYWIAGFTVVLAVVSYKQWRELQSSGQQTDRLICLYQQQLGKLDASIGQATRLAKATETANNNILTADRPWLGPTLTFDQAVAIGNVPTAVIVFTNSGKRPAKVISMGAKEGFFKTFPKNPPYPSSRGGNSSGSFLVPGAPLALALKITSGGKITEEMMGKLHGTESFFIYAKVEYLDTRTNEQHYTHGCWKYVVDKNKASPDGFYNCTVADGYNDAD